MRKYKALRRFGAKNAVDSVPDFVREYDPAIVDRSYFVSVVDVAGSRPKPGNSLAGVYDTPDVLNARNSREVWARQRGRDIAELSVVQRQIESQIVAELASANAQVNAKESVNPAGVSQE